MPARTLLAAAVTVLGLAAPAAAGASAPISSDNVRLVGRLPEAAGAISSRFSPDGRLMYTSTAAGLLIHDISTPSAPRLVGALALPHFENEDVDVGDGVVVLTNDPSFTKAGMIYIVDVRDPSMPRIRSTLNTYLPRNPLSDPGQTGNGHILNCIQGCRYVWSTGTAEGITVYDLTDLDHPRFIGRFAMPAVSRAAGQPATPGFTHDVFVDRAGIGWITGEDGTFGYDTTGDPVHPRLIYRSDETIKNSGGGFIGDDGSGPLDFLHHNSIRTDIQLAPPAAAPNAPVAGVPAGRGAGGLGDVLAVTEEDYLKPGCQGQGSLQTWQITGDHNSDGTIKLALLDQWTTELNELAAGQGRSPATGNCSAHWFDESRGLLAQGWYDQGVRFTDISDPRNIRQVGYFISAGTYWAAYFAPTDPTRQTVYALDTAGGIDVLRIDRTGNIPVQAPVLKRWLTDGATTSVASPRWGYVCPLVSPSVQQRATAAFSVA